MQGRPHEPHQATRAHAGKGSLVGMLAGGGSPSNRPWVGPSKRQVAATLVVGGQGWPVAALSNPVLSRALFVPSWLGPFSVGPPPVVPAPAGACAAAPAMLAPAFATLAWWGPPDTVQD